MTTETGAAARRTGKNHFRPVRNFRISKPATTTVCLVISLISIGALWAVFGELKNTGGHRSSLSQIRFGVSPEIQAERCLQALSKNGNRFSRDPSPSGRGCREAAGEGRTAALIGPFFSLRPNGLGLRAGHLLPRGRRTRAILLACLGQLWKGCLTPNYSQLHSAATKMAFIVAAPAEAS